MRKNAEERNEVQQEGRSGGGVEVWRRRKEEKGKQTDDIRIA